MKKTAALFPGVFIGLFLAATLQAADKDAVLAVLERTQLAYDEALLREHAWSVTEPLMDEARAALERGEVEEAEAIAARALLTAEQALAQAQAEEEAWRTRVVEN